MDVLASVYTMGGVQYQYSYCDYGPRLSCEQHGYVDQGLTKQFSEGMIGPTLFGLDWKASALCIVFFNALSSIPPAYLASNGPQTGMRQMVQARYALGWVSGLIIGLVNCISQMGFLSLTVILGGQSLSLASGSSMSWTVGIVIAAIISLLVRIIVLAVVFIGTRPTTFILAYTASCHLSVFALYTFFPSDLFPSFSSSTSSLPQLQAKTSPTSPRTLLRLPQP
jgi:purine-cytosine permease-like protein